jgi:hypothetical protein
MLWWKRSNKVLDLISKLVRVVEPSYGFKVEMFHQNKFNWKDFTVEYIKISRNMKS